MSASFMRGTDGSSPSTSSRCPTNARMHSTTLRRILQRRGDLHLCRAQDPYAFSMWREELPIPPGYDHTGLLGGIRTVATPLLSPQKVRPGEAAFLMSDVDGAATDKFCGRCVQVFDRLYNSVHVNAAEHFGAFYSSELGGIVTNPAFMVVHMDDHMVHRK